MAKIKPFEENTKQYEDWFEKNQYVYKSEVSAIKKAIPQSGEEVEIGVGTGRFASPLGIKYGADPSREMSEIATQKGIRVCNGIDVIFYLKESGFTNFTFYQTLFKPMHLISKIEPIKQGYGEGSFIVIKSQKNGDRYWENTKKL